MKSEAIPAYYRTHEWHTLRRRVLERDGHVCAYCGERASTADHVLARGHGGMDALENLVACCGICNAVAGGRWFKDFATKRLWIRNQLRKQTKVHKAKPVFERSHYEETMRLLKQKQRRS